MLASAGIGWLTAEVVSFNSDYRALLNEKAAEVQTGVLAVQGSLRTLSDVATGARQSSPDVIKKFDEEILALLEKSSSLSNLVPSSDEAFDNYKESMVQLSDSVGELTGPLNARKFIESTSLWLAAKKEFEEKVSASQRSCCAAVVVMFH